MSICPHCGQPRMDQAKRGPLLLTREPSAVYWGGVRRSGLPAVQHDLLFLLAVRGQATRLALEMVTERSSDSIRVHICRLRKWLAREALPIEITHLKGFGYQLEIRSTLER